MRIKQELSVKPQLSAELEAALFARAEDLLAVRRGRLCSRQEDVKRLAQVRVDRLTMLSQIASRALDFFAIHPDTPAVAATFAALVLAFLTLHHGTPRGLERGMPLTDSDLPEISKTNDASARYDAQRLAEQNAYEREVEDAHQRTSGGI
ncbi:hypothetical protein WDW37_20080 [Bdellovibrionota bacterium FG-1]